jgi:hypothetical protein
VVDYGIERKSPVILAGGFFKWKVLIQDIWVQDNLEGKYIKPHHPEVNPWTK